MVHAEWQGAANATLLPPPKAYPPTHTHNTRVRTHRAQAHQLHLLGRVACCQARGQRPIRWVVSLHAAPLACAHTAQSTMQETVIWRGGARVEGVGIAAAQPSNKESLQARLQ